MRESVSDRDRGMRGRIRLVTKIRNMFEGFPCVISVNGFTCQRAGSEFENEGGVRFDTLERRERRERGKKEKREGRRRGR